MNNSSPEINPVFEKNLQALAKNNAPLVIKLFAIMTNERYEVFQGKDPVDINILDTRNQSFLYSKPVEDVLAASKTLEERAHIPYRYMFGIGNGILVNLLLHDPKLKRIVVIEPEIELLYIVLNMIDLSSYLQSGKLLLDLASHIDLPRAVHYLSHSEGKIFAKLFDIEINSSYYDQYFPDEISKLFQLMADSFHSVIIGHGNCSIDSLMGIEHHVRNLPRMVSGPKVRDLPKNAYPDTAIVVSTGPSLTKQLPLLKKIQDYVTIICVDASFPILEKHGIKPDFVTALERIPETAKFFENNSLDFQKDVTFVFVSIVHQKVIDAVRAGTLMLSMRPHGYTQFFDLDDYGYIGTGMSAANLAHELAIALNFKQVFLIGQDLAFGDDDTSHAEGHVYGENEENASGHKIYVERWGGNGTIRTTEYWVLFNNYIQRAIANSRDITTYNCTEGGARIPGATELTFQEATDRYVDLTSPKVPFHPALTPESEVEVLHAAIIKKTNLWIADSIRKQEVVEEVFIKVQEASEEFVALKDADKLQEISFEWLSELTSDIDRVKAFFDDALFTNLYVDTVQSYILHFELDLAQVQIRPVYSEEEKISKLVEWVMQHRYWLFSLAGGLNAIRDTIIRATEGWPEELKNQIVIPEKKEFEGKVEA
ncbi:MAG: motility associated factor glycosyltransferase family protein [Sulfuricurvum sp.]|uniref:motility associated factor glycosyltransferase family protein n=1 Tax=Sulfuricurvum sp. TaxID=2025608 RepID=UPI00262D11B3|nr:motility associated factor glycosyltransferase family protein [Sulfuricurvum sp.]MDD2950041.1 motility associated factor glycosyltransferase family protein [Sulfuricurvum sp.]MDD5119216.1 motility associated factor glycosyltransferase family protein [Sulfuricurvum sp.]